VNNLENKMASDRTGRLLRNALLCGVSALTVGAFSAPALAQDAAAPAASSDIETVVVTGILGSLQRDLDIKRNSTGVVDAISAEDIGKFPDSSLAGAMQRIPGVTVSMGAVGGGGMNGSAVGGTGGTSSTGEAGLITVRGFGPTYNETLYDGRQVATGIGSRAFDFGSVSADFVSQLDILKTPDSTLSSGAIGATINIKFPKPFDHPGLQVAGSVAGNFKPNQGNLTPSVDFLISDTFANDTIGVLFDASYADTRTVTNHVNVQAWYGTKFAPSQFAGAAPGASTTASVPGFAIQDYGVYQDHTDDVKQSSRFVLQWRPTDALELTLNDNYARDRQHQNQYGYSIWFNQGSLRDVVENSNGTVTSFNQPNTPTDFQGQLNNYVLQNNDVGLNAKYNASDKLSLIFDYDFSEAWLNPGGQFSGLDSDVGYGPSQPNGTNGTDVGIAGVGVGNLPYPTSIGPNGNAADFLGQGILGSHVFPIGSNRNYDAINQAKIEADWTEDHLQVKVGINYMSDHQNLANYDDFGTLNAWQAYAGYGAASNNFYAPSQPGTFVPVLLSTVTTTSPVVVTTINGVTTTTGGVTTTVNTFSTPQPGDPGYTNPNCPVGANGGNPCPAGASLPQGMFTNSYSTSGFINGFGNSNALPARVLKFKPGPVRAYLESLGNPQATYVPGANKTCCNPAFTGKYTIALEPGSFAQIYEDTMAAYLTATEDTSIGGMPLKINFGLREEETAVRSSGIGQTPTSFTVQASDHTAFAVAYGPTQIVTGTNRYTNLLPNLDLVLNLTDDIQLRLDASRTLTKPPLSSLSPVQSLGATRVGTVSASGGNPQLMPYLSDNVDLGVNYFYADNSYISIAGFNKNVTNFLNNQAIPKTFAGVIDPTTGAPVAYTYSTTVNGPSAKVDGVELAIQNVFGDSGWGFQANATIVGTNTPYNPNNRSSVTPFAITGLANSANLVGFYEKNGFQARVAVNWRAAYLDHFGQIQGGSIYGTEPTFVNSTTQVDFSTSYDLTEHFNIYLEALNLNDATYSTHGRYAEQLLDADDYGRTFKVGIHWKL
jgi:outer membrane receptor protein involved in Fe transport